MKILFYLFAALFIVSCSHHAPPLKQNEKIVKIENYLDSLEGFSGAVLIAHHDSIIFRKAYGYAHIGHQIKNTPETKFSYASIGKSFTALATFQLIQKGLLSLNDPVGKYLPEYPNKTVRENVTIEMLLTHRSGLPNYFHSEEFLQTTKTKFRTLKSLSELYENMPMESAPNEQFAYRNTNYVILGRIIEAIVDQSYEEYFEKNIFSIAGMKNTGNFDIDHPIENAAEGYTLSGVYPNELQKNTFMGSVKGSPAGGGYSTVDDLFNYALAFKHHRLLNSTYCAIMKKEPTNGFYGYGMQFGGSPESGIYGHTGGHYGTGAEWRIYEKEGYIVILLTNKDQDEGFYSARYFIEQTIAGTRPRLDNYFFTQKLINVCINQGYYQAKKDLASTNKELSEIDLNMKGYQMIQRGLPRKAIDLFQLEVSAFPNSYDAYDSLGEAYAEQGERQKAIENYKKSLELNPENKNAEERIKILSSKK